MSADVIWRGLPAGDAGLRPVEVASAAAAKRPVGRHRRRPFGLLCAESEAIGLRCDLETANAAAASAPTLTIIEIDGREVGELLAETGDRRRAAELLTCPVRRRLMRRRIGRCLVAMTRRAEPCFVQWLLDHSDNQALRRGFGATCPHLLRDEALVEGAFTLPSFDPDEIVPAAMARIAARAAPLGVRWVHSFVPVEETATLRLTLAAGFTLHQWRVQRRRLWRRTTSFGPLPADWQQHPA